MEADNATMSQRKWFIIHEPFRETCRENKPRGGSLTFFWRHVLDTASSTSHIPCEHTGCSLWVQCGYTAGIMCVLCVGHEGTHACPMRQCIHFAAHWRQVLHWPLRRSQVTACHTMHRCRSIHFNAKTMETRTSAPGTMQSTKSHFLSVVQLGVEVHALNRGIAKLQGKKRLQSMVLTST